MDKRWGIIGGVVLVIVLLSPLFLGSSKNVQQLYNEGNSLFTQRKYSDAIELYEKAIKASKKLGAETRVIDKDFTALAHYKIALCYDKLGETTKDVTNYKRAIELIKKALFSTNVHTHKENLTYLWAQILYKTESFEEAEAKYSSFVQFYPNSRNMEEALIRIGTINTDLNNHEEALNAFQRVIDEFPTSKFRSDAEYYIPKVLVEENKTDIKVMNEDESMYNIALVKFNQNQDYKAYQLFTGIIKQYPESDFVSFAYEGIGDIYYRNDNLVNAQHNYEKAMHSTTDNERKQVLLQKYQDTFLIPDTPDTKPDPSHISGLFVKANLLRIERKYAEAAPLYEKLSNSEIPNDDIAYALYWGGFTYYKSAIYDKSVQLFDKYIREHEDRTELLRTYYYLATTYFEWGNEYGHDKTKYQLVVQTVDEAIAIPSNIQNTADRRWLSKMHDLKDKAIRYLPNNNAPQPNPKPVNADVLKLKQYDQALMSFDENQYDKAISEFEKCLDMDPYFVKAYCNLGVIYILKKDYTKAINELNQALNIDPKFKEAYFNIGLAYLRIGYFKEAKISADNALQIDANYEAAQVLRDSIAE